MLTIDLTTCCTRVVCAPDGEVGAAGRTVASALAPALVQRESEPVAFTYGGAPLFEQKVWRLERRDVTRLTGGDKIVVQKTVDGERAVAEGASEVKIGEAYEGELVFSLPRDNRIFGLGQHENGVYDYRGRKEYLVQNNMKIPMPIMLCAGPAGNFAVVFDAGCLMTFEESEGEARFTFDAVRRVDYYIIAGKSLDKVTRGIRELTGAAVMLPRWAFGYIQSRERYKTQDEILETAERFRASDIPVSCLVQDWHTWGKGKWGNKRADRERYPDIKGMLEKLHGMDIAFMLSVWPNAAIGSEDNAELAEAGALLANASTYNAFDGRARELYWKQCEREWFSAGTDGWWCDSTEPFTADWRGAVKKSDAERYEMARGVLTKYLDARDANDFALVHAQGIYENQRRASAAKRVINLTRSGSPSIQRYGVILWSGDIRATWDVLRGQLIEGLNICAAGIPYWTVDIGAFFVGSDRCWRVWSGSEDKETPWFWHGDYEDGVADPRYRELYTRWLQWGAFLPIMRSHGTDTPREPWNFGEPGEPYYDAILKYIRLRYRLLPYTYSLAGMVTREGYTMMRNLNFDFAHDETARGISDEYMYGPAFLVCPVLEPSERRRVYLPAGGWFDFETKEFLEGGRSFDADAPLDTMPVYVRTGSIVPVSNGGGEADGLEVYAGADASFTLYFDNGRDYAYEDGEFAAVTVAWDDGRGELSVTVAEGSYPYPGSLRTTVYRTDGERAEGELVLTKNKR